MQTSAVLVEVPPPPVRYDRVQLAIRLAVLVAFALVGGSLGWAYSLLYLLLPVFAAVMSDRKVPQPVNARDAHALEVAVRWVVGFFAYMSLVTDTPPWDPSGSPVRFAVQHPLRELTAAGALVRLLTSLPAALVTALANLVAGLAALFGAVSILVGGTVPPGVHGFLARVLFMNARLLAYHGSLVDEYPLGATGAAGGAAPSAT